MRQNKLAFGIALMIMGMVLFAIKDGLAKLVVQDIGPAQIIWTQFVYTFVLFAALTAPRHGWRAFMPTPFKPQLIRGLASVSSIGIFYWSLAFIPLADATSMSMIAPMVVVALSPFVLGERIGIRRILAVAMGFAGVLVILRPGFSSDIVGYLIAFLAGLLFGVFYLGNRLLAGRHPPFVNIAHNVLFGTVLLAPVMPFVWIDPLQTQFVNFIGLVIIASLGQSLMVSSFLFGPASIIAPYQHSVIVFVVIVGYVIFGTLPDLLTWIGITMIVGAGLYIALRENRLAAQKSAQTAE